MLKIDAKFKVDGLRVNAAGSSLKVEGSGPPDQRSMLKDGFDRFWCLFKHVFTCVSWGFPEAFEIMSKGQG